MPARVTCWEYDRKKRVPVPGYQRLDVNSRTLLKMIQRGEGFKETAKRFGIVKSTICYRLQRDFPKEYRKLRVNPTFAQYYARCAEAYEVYKRIGSIRRTARELGLSKSTVLGRIKFMEKSLKRGEREAFEYEQVLLSLLNCLNRRKVLLEVEKVLEVEKLYEAH